MTTPTVPSDTPSYGQPWPQQDHDEPPARSAGPVPSTGRHRPSLALVALALGASLLGGGVGAAVGVESTSRATPASSPLRTSAGTSTTGIATTGTAPVQAGAGTVAAAAATATPSVVKITEHGAGGSATGSGVVLTRDGYILTNNHVVAEAADGGTVSVTLADGRRSSARIVGRDPSSDLAVIQIRGVAGLVPATLGSSEGLQVGDLVVAIGAPLGLAGTVTSGIVSSLHRPVRTGDPSVSDSDAVLDAVQTDAAINPGNSGGPLVDSAGRVLGINSAIATLGGDSTGSAGQSGNIGVGFAIPIDYARGIADQLIRTGSATHAYLGVEATTAGSTTAGSDPTDGTGAELRSVQSGAPAAKAGLQVGDVVTAVRGRPVNTVDGLVAAVRSAGVGTALRLTYLRNGASHTVTVTTVAAPRA